MWIQQHMLLFATLAAAVPLVVVLAFMIPVWQREGDLKAATRRLRTEGTRANAVLGTLRQVDWIGSRHAGWFVFEVSWTLDGTTRTSRCIVSTLARPSFTPGSTVPVFYSPQHGEVIALDEEALGYRGSTTA